MLINLCCGGHVWDGWLCLDPRTHVDPRIIAWKWGQRIPVDDSTVDGILVSYGWLYAPKEKYPEHLTECWRVLKPGGVLVIKEDDDRLRVWRQIGTKHKTGLIRSTSNEPEMKALMEAAGFQVEATYPLEFEEALDTHRMARGKSYVLTGRKA